MSNIHTLTLGATNNRLRLQLRDADGVAPDLTGATVKLIYRPDGDNEERTMTVTDADEAECEYQFDEDDFEVLTRGDWPMNVEVTYSDESVDYFPSRERGSLDSEIYDVLRVREPV